MGKIHQHTPTSADPERMDTDDLLEFIGLLTDRMEHHQEETERLRHARVRAFRAGRSRIPPVRQRDMAEAARIKEPAVIAALRKDEERRHAG